MTAPTAIPAAMAAGMGFVVVVVIGEVPSSDGTTSRDRKCPRAPPITDPLLAPIRRHHDNFMSIQGVLRILERFPRMLTVSIIIIPGNTTFLRVICIFTTFLGDKNNRWVQHCIIGIQKYVPKKEAVMWGLSIIKLAVASLRNVVLCRDMAQDHVEEAHLILTRDEMSRLGENPDFVAAAKRAAAAKKLGVIK